MTAIITQISVSMDAGMDGYAKLMAGLCFYNLGYNISPHTQPTKHFTASNHLLPPSVAVGGQETGHRGHSLAVREQEVDQGKDVDAVDEGA